MKLNNKNKSGYVLYSRVSSNGIADNQESLKQQFKMIKKYLKKNGYKKLEDNK